MVIRKFDSELLGYISLFKKATNVDLHDCFVLNDGCVMFVTDAACAAKAIGKGGRNVKYLRDTLKKDLKIIEYAEDPVNLVRNFVYPLSPKELALENNEIKITFNTGGERRVLLNNNLKGLKNLKEFIARYHKDVADVKIL